MILLLIGLVLVFVINIVLFVLLIKEFILYMESRRRNQLRKKMKKVQEKERKQLVHYISTELHDNISQMISLSVMNLGMLQTNESNKYVENTRELLDKTLVSLKHLIKTVRLEEATVVDLEHHLEELLLMLNQSSSVLFSKTGKVPYLGNERSYLVFRILQEFATNIVKYSKAQNVEIVFDTKDLYTIIKIKHNGGFFFPQKEDFQKGYGLSNIYENASLLKATLKFNDENDKIVLKFPIGKI